MSPISSGFPFLWGQRFCHKIILCTCNLYVKGHTILYFPRSILGFLVNLPQSPTCAHSHFLLIYSFLILLHPVYHLLVLVTLANTVQPQETHCSVFWLLCYSTPFHTFSQLLGISVLWCFIFLIIQLHSPVWSFCESFHKQATSFPAIISHSVFFQHTPWVTLLSSRVLLYVDDSPIYNSSLNLSLGQ